MKKLFAIIGILALISFVYIDGGKPCGIKGDGKNKRMQYNDSLKNRSLGATNIDLSITLDAMLASGDDTHRFSSSTFVTVEGYIVKAMYGGAETCECHSKNKDTLDIHIELSPTPELSKSSMVIVEVTRYTKNSSMNYEQILKMRGHKVRVSGYLFFDEEHKQNAYNTNPTGTNLWRSTCWEVHPVTSIQVIN